MSFELNGLIESLQRGVATIPPVVIAIGLLAGPTAALVGYHVIGYRVVGMARRLQLSSHVDVPPLWVCRSCRSVNEVRLSRCYRCGREAASDVEFVFAQPSASPAFFEVPAGSPFAALSAATNQSAGENPGMPVMADSSFSRDPVAVGPGHPVDAPAWPVFPEVEPARLVRSPVHEVEPARLSRSAVPEMEPARRAAMVEPRE
jgi:hypothetical protein